MSGNPPRGRRYLAARQVSHAPALAGLSGHPIDNAALSGADAWLRAAPCPRPWPAASRKVSSACSASWRTNAELTAIARAPSPSWRHVPGCVAPRFRTPSGKLPGWDCSPFRNGDGFGKRAWRTCCASFHRNGSPGFAIVARSPLNLVGSKKSTPRAVSICLARKVGANFDLPEHATGAEIEVVPCRATANWKPYRRSSHGLRGVSSSVP